MKMADPRDTSYHFQQKEIRLEGSLPRKTLTSTSLSFLPENAQHIGSLFFLFSVLSFEIKLLNWECLVWFLATLLQSIAKHALSSCFRTRFLGAR